MNRIYNPLTRIFDILISLSALFILSPVLIPIMFLLRFTGEGDIFYLQTRIGLNKKRFEVIKFATMLKDSPNMGTGPITTRNDPRVLPVGRVLRKTKINELPQLINIIMGTMSIVGPRPLMEKQFFIRFSSNFEF